MMEMNMENYPRLIEAGLWDAGHVQGIAIDTEKGYIYFQFKKYYNP